jgi:Domain of unknown function (DUF4150)
MYGTTKAGGMQSSTVPDMCKTMVGVAVVPMPYPCMGNPAGASPTATKVYFCGALTLTSESKTQPTNGDEAGASGGGGVKSGKIDGPAAYTSSSGKVKIEGNPAVRLNDTMTLNDGNTVGMNSAPSQTKVMIMS